VIVLKGSVRRRNCTCKKKRCTCGAKYFYVIDTGKNPANGNRKQKSKSGFSTQAEAWDACNEAIYELKNGTYVHESNAIFKDFSQEWLVHYQKKHRIKVSTVRIRRHEIGLLMPYFAHIRIKDITKKKYQEALNDLKDKDYADNTLSGVHATGRMIFKMAMEYDMIKKDPTQYAMVPKSPKTVEELEAGKEIPSYLEKEELSLFLKMSKEKGLDKDHETFMLLAYTGMRVGELCVLKWADIDHENCTISITKTYYNPNNNTVLYGLLPPKTKASKRVIEVDEVVLSLLDRHKSRQKPAKMRLRDVYLDEDFVFANTKRFPGYPELIKTVENRMRRLLKLAGLNQELTPHSLRHTHTSLLAEAGVSLPQIMDRLGHVDDDTTKKVYLHVTKTMKKEASQKFSELMKGL